jgi:succinate dehydrogenase/fumarate reductase flavoprotein subunit
MAEGSRRVEADVIVVGFGAAGIAAAIEAYRAGAEVIVLEKMPEARAGGNTRVSGGVWFRSLNVEAAAEYFRQLSGSTCQPDDFVRVWAAETYATTEWVESLGPVEIGSMDIPAEYPELPGSECYGGYVHCGPAWGGGHLHRHLAQVVHDLGIAVHYETRATRLLQEAGRAVVGVHALRDGQPVTYAARRGVVLASGGFENNRRMMLDYLRLDVAGSWGSPGNTGDGIAMAQALGADLWHMNNSYSIVGVPTNGALEGSIYADFPAHKGVIFVGPDGSRFADETTKKGHGKALVNGRYELFPHQPMNVIFDEATRMSTRVASAPPYSWAVLIEDYEWSADNLAEIDNGWIVRAETPGELAGALGMDPDTFAAELTRYKASCAAGVDERFGRAPETLIPLSTPPYYGFRFSPGVVYTCGGPRRNERSEVLDVHGEVIPRLFAAGEISSSYSWCMDGGMMIADALAFGRIAGRSAAATDR